MIENKFNVNIKSQKFAKTAITDFFKGVYLKKTNKLSEKKLPPKFQSMLSLLIVNTV